MSRDNWARLVEAVVRREQIWQMFHAQSRSPSISTIESENDTTSNSSAEITNDNLNALYVSSSVLVRNPVSKKADSTGPFSRNLFSSWYRRWMPKDNSLVNIPIPEFDVGDDVTRFSVSELEAATDNFNKQNLCARGGYHYVYKGRLADGSQVVVKRFKIGTNQYAELRFQTELEILGHMVAHPNVLRLLGYCITSRDQMLVFPFMVNGSVASCLRERPKSRHPLNWSTRRRIALGTAKGLAYLHDKCDRKIIHRDVKAANILLDENFEAVVADLELAKLLDHSDDHVDTAVQGTIGHIAPEYLSSGKCSEKTDVFGYGVFLLELISGQRAFDLARLANDDDVMLLDWVKMLLLEKKWSTIMDPDCKDSDLMEEEVEQLIQLALLCTRSSPEGRPKMSVIVTMLDGYSDGLVEKWEQWLKEDIMKNYSIYSKFSPELIDWIIAEDTLNILPEELSGPR